MDAKVRAIRLQSRVIVVASVLLAAVAFLVTSSIALGQEAPKEEAVTENQDAASDEPATTPTTTADDASTPPSAPPAPAAQSDINGRASVEVAGYQDSLAVSVLTPSIGVALSNPIAGWSLNGRYIVDMVSAASPDIVATASPRWSEVRNAGNVGGRYKPGNVGVGVGLATSYTPDYLSLGANGQLVEDLDDKNLTLTQGYGFGHDVIGRTGTPFSVFNRQLDYHSFSIGASRVINSALVLSLATDVVIERGDQSKPYRYIPIFTPEQAGLVSRGESVDSVARMRIQARPLEQLPLERERGALTGRLAWRLSTSTLRIEERIYGDTWGLRASTTDARWLFDVGERVILWPHLRLHVQNGVDFWRRAYSAINARDLPALRTGDLELGPLSNLGVGGGIRLSLGKRDRRDDWALTTSVDGTWTSYHDAIYVKERFRILAAMGLEVAF